MAATRYAIATEHARGRRTLEIACAAGMGLGLLAGATQTLVAGDINAALLDRARTHYGVRVPLVRFSATELPFANESFDFVLFLEASYYVPQFEKALDEISRVLALGGRVLFANANPERPDFIRSPHSRHYHSATEFRELLASRGFDVETYAAFPVLPVAASGDGRSMLTARLPQLRRAAEALHLIPRTLEGRARLKRLLFGKLQPMPAELPDAFAPLEPLVPAGNEPVRAFKVIYVLGTRRGTKPR